MDSENSVAEPAHADSTPTIDVQQVEFSYESCRALAGVSFQVHRGEIFSLLGPNGAGKSTMIKLLTGQLSPAAGRIQILGNDVQQHRQRIQDKIGVVFEQQNLYLDMTPGETLRFFAALFGNKDFDPTDLLARVGLEDRATTRVSELSKGLRQRVMIARCLVNQPKLILLDEPTSGLDPVSSRSIKKIIREEAARGAAILLTTHDMQTADELSDRVAFINEGQILAMDTTEQLKLNNGHRSVRVRFQSEGEVREEIIPLDTADSGRRMKQAVADENMLTIHTDEASLEEIFVTFAGRGLDG